MGIHNFGSCKPITLFCQIFIPYLLLILQKKAVCSLFGDLIYEFSQAGASLFSHKMFYEGEEVLTQGSKGGGCHIHGVVPGQVEQDPEHPGLVAMSLFTAGGWTE